MDEFKFNDIVYYTDMFSVSSKGTLVEKYVSTIENKNYSTWILKSIKRNGDIIYVFVPEYNLSKDGTDYEIELEKIKIKEQIDELKVKLSKL